jgi:soluble lytic murein transglycosylase
VPKGAPVSLAPPARKRFHQNPAQVVALGLLVMGLVVAATWWVLTREGDVLDRQAGWPDVPEDAIATIHSSTPIPLRERPPAPPAVDYLLYAPEATGWSQELREAYRARQEGRYEAAIALYSALVGSGKPQEARHALWGLAETYEASGRPELAIRAYSLFTRLDDPRAAQALGRVARLYEQRGLTSQAIEVYEDYERLAGPARHAIMLMRARLLGATPEAEKLYRAVLDDKPQDPDLRQALAGLAGLKSRQGQHAEAARLYDQLASVRRANPRPVLDYDGLPAEVLAAREIRLAGDEAGARRRLVEYINGICTGAAPCMPTYPYGAYMALDDLLKLDAAAVLSGTVSPMVAAHIAFSAGYYSNAITYMDVLRSGSPNSPGLPAAALLTGKAFDMLGDHASAYNWHTATVQTYPSSPQAPEAARLAADALVEQAAWDAALAVYQEAIQRYPDAADHTALARVNGAVLAYRLDRRDTALDLIAPVVAGGEYSPTLKAEAAFWHGKLLKGAGHPGWRQSLQQVSVLAPGSYFDFRARSLLAGEPDGGPVLLTFSQSGVDSSALGIQYDAEGEERALLLRWASSLTRASNTLAGTATPSSQHTQHSGSSGRSGSSTLTPAAGDTGQSGIASPHPELLRAVTLLDLGYEREASRSLRALAERLRGERDAYRLAQLVLYARYHADPPTMMSLAEMLAEMGGQGDPLDAPTLLLKTMYPTPYVELVMEEARVRDMDPLVLYALIRQESRFVPEARSHADARGLTQVIPSTGDGIAARLEDNDFSSADLYLPYISIRYGAYYLAANAPQFDRKLLPTLAAYNGGPGNAARWLAGSALIDPDLYAERIDFFETRDYLRRVYRNYGFYRHVYAGPP